MGKLRAVGVISACLLVSGINQPTSPPASVWLAGGSVFEPSYCAYCEYCAGSGVDHRAPLFASAFLGGAHEWCMSIVCSHPECSQAAIPIKDKHPEDLEKLLGPAWKGNMWALGQLLERFPERVVVNKERRVVQLIACSGGGISGQLPVSEAQIALLLDARSLALR